MNAKANQNHQRLGSVRGSCPPASRQIESEYINDTLTIYRKNFIALRSADWDGARIHGRFAISQYPFTNPGHITYVTAAMAILYLSQLSYLAARLLIEDQRLLSHTALNTSYFKEARDRGDLVITTAQLRFRKKIPLSLHLITVAQRLKRIVATRTSVFAEFDFAVEESSASGTLVVAMPLPT